ncbi:Phospholipase D/Transphosphatidylase [Oceaniovalibus guishaninsula JLT2003]|uniref:Phospholipase D n=1 Tax=Oceaniovalibus guishaninsula JLT2003 TaxID=1231392 RepID=K2GRR3_9RHOB|nr:phospholipase D-like domain-containing protein [Oceaniovalibus guishaninsula]EKE45326.1 Phospholipase D/Transphosphatidylase [Oceaniovalibus guishaninsula JLT2003]
MKDQAASLAESIFQPGRNCWRVEQADRISLIVDAALYFAALRKAIIEARSEILLVGWDFDFEIEMLPGESDEDGVAPDGYPNQLGPFLLEVIDRNPDLELYILKWNGALLAAPGRLLPSLSIWAASGDRIHFALDSHHPFGACHHQKIVVIDNSLAFCGGIDVTEERWDTPDHAPEDPRRTRRDGTLIGPWHDVTTAITGPAATALGDLSRMRWQRATGEELGTRPESGKRHWPDILGIDLEDAQLAIARTEPPYDGGPLVNEIEHLYLDAIRAAKRIIYIESQYLTAKRICRALCRRLRHEDGPEIVVINPEAARSAFEDAAMHTLRGRIIRRLRTCDKFGRFGIWNPVNAAGTPIYVHAKVLIVDDDLLRIGSSNLDNRSMGFDTECDIAVTGRQEDHAQVIARFRSRLLGEHLGVSPDTVEAAVEREGSYIAAIEALGRPTGRGLRRIEVLEETWFGSLMASTQMLDQRFYPGQRTSSGKGIRPRHLAVAAGVAGIGVLALLLWRRRRDR